MTSPKKVVRGSRSLSHFDDLSQRKPIHKYSRMDSLLNPVSAEQQSAILAARSWHFRANTHMKSNCLKTNPTSSKYAVADDLKQNEAPTLALSELDPAVPLDELFKREIIPIPHDHQLDTEIPRLTTLIEKNIGKTVFDPDRVRLRSGRKESTGRKKYSLKKPVQVHNNAKNESIFSVLSQNQITQKDCLPIAVSNAPLHNEFRLGLDNYKVKQYGQCLQSSSTPKNRAVVFFNRAISYAELSKLTEAIKDLDEAIKLHAENIDFYLCRSVLFRLQGDYISAAIDCETIQTIKSAGKSNAFKKFSKKTVQGLVCGQQKNLRAKLDPFVEAYQTAPSERTPHQLDILVKDSHQIPFLSTLDDNILIVIWRNLIFQKWENDETYYLGKSEMSLFLLLSGTLDLQAESSGVLESQKLLLPGNFLCKSSISANLWRTARFITQTPSSVLVLPNAVYKYTVKNMMIEGANKRSNFFRRLPVFTKWSSDQIRTLGVMSEELSFPPDTIVEKEGDPAQYLYFVLNGIGAAVRLIGEKRVQLGSLYSGDVFGENAILDPISGKITATVISQTTFTVVRIEKHNLNRRRKFDLMRLGKIDGDVLQRIKQLSVRSPSDKMLIQMIKDKCSWESQRRDILKKYLNEKDKSNGIFHDKNKVVTL